MTVLVRITHVVVTDAFAGVERYITDVANEQARRGHQVRVVGGAPTAMRAALVPAVTWQPGSTIVTARRSLGRQKSLDLLHVHMTKAELVGAVHSLLGSTPVVATRHFAAHRGSSPAARVVARWLRHRLAAEIAISGFVAQALERPPTATIVNGVPVRDTDPAPEPVVLVAQRLEPEKQTELALEAWRLCGLSSSGWRLRIAGQGSDRDRLEALVEQDRLANVDFLGWLPNLQDELRRASVLLATAPAEPLGLTVLEAMASEVPVVATAAGGHLETVGRVEGARMFPVDDALAAAKHLRELARNEECRRSYAQACRRMQASGFSVPAHVDALEGVYSQVLGTTRPDENDQLRSLST